MSDDAQTPEPNDAQIPEPMGPSRMKAIEAWRIQARNFHRDAEAMEVLAKLIEDHVEEGSEDEDKLWSLAWLISRRM